MRRGSAATCSRSCARRTASWSAWTQPVPPRRTLRPSRRRRRVHDRATSRAPSPVGRSWQTALAPGLDRCLAPAIEAAERGVVAAAETARNWHLAQPRPSALGPPPSFGQRFYMRELATTLRAIAESGPRRASTAGRSPTRLSPLVARARGPLRLPSAVGRSDRPDLQGRHHVGASAADAGRRRARGARDHGRPPSRRSERKSRPCRSPSTMRSTTSGTAPTSRPPDSSAIESRRAQSAAR